MEIFQHLDLAGYGVAAPFVVYLLWMQIKKDKTIIAILSERDKWQDRYISLLETQTKESYEQAKIFEQVLAVLKSG